MQIFGMKPEEINVSTILGTRDVDWEGADSAQEVIELINPDGLLQKASERCGRINLDIGLSK